MLTSLVGYFCRAVLGLHPLGQIKHLWRYLGWYIHLAEIV